jgi:hypothetical protein
MLLMVLIFIATLILGGIVTGLVDGSKEERLMEDFCRIECR